MLSLSVVLETRYHKQRKVAIKVSFFLPRCTQIKMVLVKIKNQSMGTYDICEVFLSLKAKLNNILHYYKTESCKTGTITLWGCSTGARLGRKS